MTSQSDLRNVAAPGVPYFTPHQSPPSGSALPLSEQPVHKDKLPKLFEPLKIRDAVFPNRAFCAPMCMYSCADGKLTDFHMVHLGGIAYKGAGLVMVEASSVRPEGRISPEDSGIWEDAQIESLSKIVTYVHSQGHHLSVQLAHAGRKASTVAPWLAARGRSNTATADIGGWPDNVVSSTTTPWSSDYPVPRMLSIAEIKDIVKAFGDAAVRAVKAGVDSVELHAAHGYLLHQFLSTATNQRTDEYGGPFENRVRFVLEAIQEIRSRIPQGMPFFLRLSGTDWLDTAKYPGAWDIEQTIRLAKLLYPLGVDLLDVSSAGNHEEQKIPVHIKGYQTSLAGKVKKVLTEEGGEAAKLLISAVGGITDGAQANQILEEGQVDAVFIAREFLRDSSFVMRAAKQLEVQVRWPLQYQRGTFGRVQPRI
ncbi:FMN-linked oxidoreductase [Morchella conica CCBAS932]|uniref:FMN-linked oxidoreductase n=1 Tax=Morchella conica CCBAS932 TaxID=1392247 RepID=A0A3N4L581_9PEZI|nr:FMN-linked oxidoreductase [Morchella conica CCBAS932]